MTDRHPAETKLNAAETEMPNQQLSKKNNDDQESGEDSLRTTATTKGQQGASARNGRDGESMDLVHSRAAKLKRGLGVEGGGGC